MIIINSLQDFYALMFKTKQSRKNIVELILGNKSIPDTLKLELKKALTTLQRSANTEKRATLQLDDTRSIEIDLDYEINELVKDLYFIDHGLIKFIDYLSALHQNFKETVNAGVSFLDQTTFHSFITDRDGTVNNYCGRYASSIQSIYNAVFLAYFAKNAVQNACILTSAPLANIGLIDISVLPDNIYVSAGSKGREYQDKAGNIQGFPISDEKQAKIEELNTWLSNLIKDPRYEKFSLIGSGLQFKFGQTTLARQDINESIPKEESLALVDLIKALIKKIDPKDQYFRIEDTGKDIEIILTIDSDTDQLRDFDKGDGVLFLNDACKFQLEKGNALICGDTRSDTPMIPAAMKKAKDTYSIFVTKDDALKNEIKNQYPNSFFVTEPDMLITILLIKSGVIKEEENVI